MREFPNASDRESQMGGVTGNQPVAPNLGEPGSVTYGQGNPAVTPEMGRSGAGQAPRQAALPEARMGQQPGRWS